MNYPLKPPNPHEWIWLGWWWVRYVVQFGIYELAKRIVGSDRAYPLLLWACPLSGEIQWREAQWMETTNA